MLDPFKFVDLNRNLDTAESFTSWLFANHEEIRNLGLVAAAIIGFFLLFWRGISLSRSSKAAKEQAENASKSHVADTYSRAIEQLGAVDSEGKPKLELRLGGLYALEKIAKSNEDYHPQTMEVLCAYVRLHCPIKIENNKDKTDDLRPKEIDTTQVTESPSIDIQACLTIIGRRQSLFDNKPLNLSFAKINGANLVDAKLFRANLRKTSLSGADLRGADLSEADLINASLTKAYLWDADLRKADLSGADLSKANLSGADLSGADLSRMEDIGGTKYITCEQIEYAKISKETKFPDYIEIIWTDDDTYTCKMLKKDEGIES